MIGLDSLGPLCLCLVTELYFYADMATLGGVLVFRFRVQVFGSGLGLGPRVRVEDATGAEYHRRFVKHCQWSSPAAFRPQAQRI